MKNKETLGEQIEKHLQGEKKKSILLGKNKEISNSTKIWGLVIATILSIGLGVGLGVGLKSSDSNGGNAKQTSTTQTLPQATMVIYTYLENGGALNNEEPTNYHYESGNVNGDTLLSYETTWESQKETWKLDLRFNPENGVPYTFCNGGLWHIEYSQYLFWVNGSKVIHAYG